jgi:hypothetical protein
LHAGFFGPKRRHIWRLHNRLDQLPPGALRGVALASSGPLPTSLHPLTQSPEPLCSNLEVALHALLNDVSSREARERSIQGLQSEVSEIASSVAP